MDRWQAAVHAHRDDIRFLYGPLATAVACNHCAWTAHERKDGTGFAQRSRLKKLAVAHLKAAHALDGVPKRPKGEK